MNSGSIHNREELLFDYMEGNLLEGQRKQVEVLLSQDPALKAELMLWKETVVKEELPVSVPADHLYKPVSFWRKPIISAVLLIGILSSVSLGFGYLWMDNQLVIDKKGQGVSEREIAGSSAGIMPELNEKDNERSEPETPQQIVLKQPTGNLSGKKPVLVEDAGIDLPEPAEEVITSQAPDSIPVSVQNIYIPVEDSLPEQEDTILPSQVSLEKAKAELSKPAKLTKEEKKKLREISRMKRKALERKEQQQFMKGNKPYVVPPHLKNF